MGTVEVPHEFFIDERRRLYPYWQRDFWRELIQNSADAQSRRIELGVHPTDDGCMAFCTDDGCGMSREVLEGVYFALGKSTKNDAGSVGGFGRARILTCFSHPYYQILTRDNFVEGVGTEFGIKDADLYTNGTQVFVHINDADVDSMRTALSNYLSYCQLGHISVYVDNVRWRNWLYRNRHVRELSFGSVYTNRSASHHLRGHVFFRVDGQFMFHRMTSADAQVVVEIDSDYSRDILTATRGGLMSQYQDELDEFLGSLAVDTKSALRPRTDKGRVFNRGRVIHSAAPQDKNTDDALCEPKSRSEQDDTVESHEDSEGVYSVAGFQVAVKPVRQASFADFTEQDYKIKRQSDQFQFNDDGEQLLAPNLFSVTIVDETDNSLVRRVIDSYDPSNWVHATQYLKGQMRSWRKGMDHLKTLITWKVCCEHAIHCLQQWYSEEKQNNSGLDIFWSVGWIFSDDTLARCASDPHNDGIYHFLLNPVDDHGKRRFNLTKPSINSMLASAVHEVSHIVYAYHNEDYAGLLTELMKRCDQSHVWGIVRSQVKGM